MFAAIKWETPLPWEKKGGIISDQEAANRAAAGLMDQMGPLSLRKATTSRMSSTSSQAKSTNNAHLVNRALVPSAEQMMSNALIGSSASRYAVIKERRTGFFLDTSLDNLNISDNSKSPKEDCPSPQINSDGSHRTLSRRNSASVRYLYTDLIFFS